MNNPITKIRDLVEVTTGLARIGASLVAERVREAAGVPRLRDCDACGRCGIDPSVCLDDEFEPVCGDCAGVRFGDLARHLDTASFHAIMARRETDKARADLADLTRIHDEALAALSVAIQRAETAEKTLAPGTAENCETCDGEGRYDDVANSDAPGPIWADCPDCDGTGLAK